VEHLLCCVSVQLLCPKWQICDSFLPLSTSCQFISCGHLFFFSVISYTFKLDKDGWSSSHWIAQKYLLAQLIKCGILTGCVGEVVFWVFVWLCLEQNFFTQLTRGCVYNTFNNTTHPINLLVSVDVCQFIKNKHVILQRFCCNLESQMVLSAAKLQHTSEALCLIGHISLVPLQNRSSERVCRLLGDF